MPQKVHPKTALFKMKHNLLVLSSTFPRWNNDTDPLFVYELSRRLTSHFNVIVLTPHYPGAQSKEIMAELTVIRFRYFFERFEKLAGEQAILTTLQSNKLSYLLIPFFLLAQFFAILSTVRTHKITVIHAHWLIPQGLLGVITGALTGVPCVVTAHGADVFSLKGATFRLLKRLVLKNAKTVTFVSKALLKTATTTIYHAHDIEVVPMGVDANLFSPCKRDPLIRKQYSINGPLLLFVGRLTEKKGARYLIEAMPRVTAQIPNARLLIIGGGELENNLTNQVVNLKLSSNVVFLGAVPNQDLPAYYATADVFIGPSIETDSGDTEGFGLTFVEAAMSGCPIIGSDIGGIGDIVRHQETGLLVPPEESKTLAETILFCLKNRQQVEKLAKNARLFCTNRYDWPIISEKYSQILSGATNENHSSHQKQQ